MSQLTRIVFRSCGLTVGWNMAPPPPGPRTLKLPGRGASPLPLARRKYPRSPRRKKSAIAFLIICFAFFLGRILLLCQSFSSLFRSKMALGFDLQEPDSIFVVHLLEDLIRQSQAINPPAPLRRHPRRGVIEILVFGFQKPVIDFVQLVGEDLLRRVRPVRNGVGSK